MLIITYGLLLKTSDLKTAILGASCDIYIFTITGVAMFLTNYWGLTLLDREIYQVLGAQTC